MKNSISLICLARMHPILRSCTRVFWKIPIRWMRNGSSILPIWASSPVQPLSMLPTYRFVNHLPLWLKRKLPQPLRAVWTRQWWKSKSAFCVWFLPIVYKAWVQPNLIRSNVSHLKISKLSILSSMVCQMPIWRFNSIWARAIFPVRANCLFPKSSATSNKPTAVISR